MSPPTAYDVAVHHPTVHPADATAADVRAFLSGAHVHLALIGQDDLLLTAIEVSDLVGADAGAAARDLGTLAGRTVRADLPEADLVRHFASTTARRLAVVDAEGRLLGLVCRKRSGKGWCTDEGIAAKRVAGD